MLRFFFFSGTLTFRVSEIGVWVTRVCFDTVWGGALNKFVDWASNEGFLSPSLIHKSQDLGRRTSRDINLRLRFKVMQRDNFKCCACGNAPAIDPSTILHIDHIIPWSKGGETIMENLQTLCQNCNLGKNDLG